MMIMDSTLVKDDDGNFMRLTRRDVLISQYNNKDEYIVTGFIFGDNSRVELNNQLYSIVSIGKDSKNITLFSSGGGMFYLTKK